MGEIKQILRKKRKFYLFSKVILAVLKVRHLPQLPPLRYGHDIWWYAVPGDDGTREEGKAIYICSCIYSPEGCNPSSSTISWYE